MSRGRKKAKSGRSGERVLRVVPAAGPEPCDCPACSGVAPDPRAPADDLVDDLPDDLVDDLVEAAAELLETDDPIEAELFGAGLVAAAGDGLAEILSRGVVPALERRATPESVAVLLAIDAMDYGSGALDAAYRVLESQVPGPVWTNDLSYPVEVGVGRRFTDPAGESSVLVCSFDRAGRSHGFVLQVDHTDDDAAVDIAMFPGEALDQVCDTVRADGRRAGVTLTDDELEPAEFRRQVERALDARQAHDLEGDDPDPVDDDAGPGYHTLAALLRARMRTLPAPPRPPADGMGTKGQGGVTRRG